MSTTISAFVHGLRYLPDDFTPRPVFSAFQNVNALFSDTELDSKIQVQSSEIPALQRRQGGAFLAHGFRTDSESDRRLLAGRTQQSRKCFPALAASLTLKNSGIERPVLIDVVSGEISRLTWKSGTTDTLDGVPVGDRVMAIADESFFDWEQLPEAPSSLDVRDSGGSVELSWEIHGGGTTGVAVERRRGNRGTWERVAKLFAAKSYRDTDAPSGQTLCYRVRAVNEAGESAYSNIARVAR